MMKLTEPQLATVLAALRYWQRKGLMSATEEQDIATDGDSFRALDSADIDDLCESLNCDSEPDPDALFSHNLHSPELESVIPAVIQAYESVRCEAESTHLREGVPVAVVYDRISNAEDETPFSFCPPAAVPTIQRHGTVLVTIGA